MDQKILDDSVEIVKHYVNEYDSSIRMSNKLMGVCIGIMNSFWGSENRKRFYQLCFGKSKSSTHLLTDAERWAIYKFVDPKKVEKVWTFSQNIFNMEGFFTAENKS